jgi:hypothetical protein
MRLPTFDGLIGGHRDQAGKVAHRLPGEFPPVRYPVRDSNPCYRRESDPERKMLEQDFVPEQAFLNFGGCQKRAMLRAWCHS